MEYRERLARVAFLLKEVGEGTLQDRGSSGMRDEFKALVMNGLPEISPLRPATYRHILNLSPPTILSSQYSAFVEELGSRLTALPSPSLGILEELVEDKLLREIERDVKRTFGELAWFSSEDLTEGARKEEGEGEDGGEVEDPFWKRIGMLEKLEEDRARNLADITPTPSSSSQFPSTSNLPSTSAIPSLSLLPPTESGEEEGTISLPPTPTTPKANSSNLFPLVQSRRTRRQALLRPLYIYATLNPGIYYVQGMNSILAVLSWIFSSATSSTSSPLEAEASAFFALGAILSQIRDLFVKSLDGSMIPTSPRSTSMSPTSSTSSSSSSIRHSSLPNSTPAGLNATLTRFTSLLTWLDPDLSHALEENQIHPSSYIFKWITTLFSNEFELPDLVRVWDRLVGLFPGELDQGGGEALSPILGHLLDLSLAIVIMKKSIILAPTSNFSIIISTLQDLQIEGSEIDKLLFIAWDIRDRRLGRRSRRSAGGGSISSISEGGGGDWRSRLGAVVNATASGPTATSLRSRWFGSTNPTSNPEKNGEGEKRLSQQQYPASEFDLDDSISQADSDTSTSTQPMLFASKGQSISSRNGGGDNSSSRRISLTNTLGLEQVDGRFLPPPPEMMDQREKFGEMNLPLPPSIVEEEETEEQFSSEDEDFGATFRAKAISSWGGWKNSLARLASSDTAASISKTTTNLSLAASLSAASISQSASQFTSSDRAASISKATTNLTIQAQMLRNRVSEETPERFTRIKENVSAASGRFLASTGSESGPGGPRRPGSPVAEPFTPPRWGDSPSMGRRPVSPAPFGTGTSDNFNLTGGPKPLILSSAARRASSSDGNSGNNNGETLSPPTSKRNSISWMKGTSPSPSGGAYKDLPIPNHSTPTTTTTSSHPHFPEPTSINSNSRVSASAFRSPSTAPTQLGLKALDDHPHFPEPLSGTLGDGSPIASRRILTRRQELEEEDNASISRRSSSTSSSSPSAVPSSGGRGWSLSDAPTSSLLPHSRPAVLDLSKELLLGPSPSLPPLPFESPIDFNAATIQSPIEEDLMTPIESSPRTSQRSRRKSVPLKETIPPNPSSSSSSSPTTTTTSSPEDYKPSRQSSTASTESQTQSIRTDAPQRSKVLRKAPARKRTSRHIESMGDVSGLSSISASSSNGSGRVSSVDEGFTIREVRSDRNSLKSENGNEVEDILDSYNS